MRPCTGGGLITKISRMPRSVPFFPTFHLSSSAVANSSIDGVAPDLSGSTDLTVTTAI